MIFGNNEYSTEEAVFKLANRGMYELKIQDDIHLLPSPGHLAGTGLIVPPELDLLYLKMPLVCHTTWIDSKSTSRLSSTVQFNPEYGHLRFNFNEDVSTTVIHPGAAGVLHVCMEEIPSNLLIRAYAVELSFGIRIAPTEVPNIYFDVNTIYINSPFDDNTNWVPDFSKYSHRALAIVHYGGRTGYNFWFRKDRLLKMGCWENILMRDPYTIHTFCASSRDWVHVREDSDVYHLMDIF